MLASIIRSSDRVEQDDQHESLLFQDDQKEQRVTQQVATTHLHSLTPLLSGRMHALSRRVGADVSYDPYMTPCGPKGTPLELGTCVM